MLYAPPKRKKERLKPRMPHKRKNVVDQAATENRKIALPLIYYKDFYDWPKHWMGFKEDIDVGGKILQEFIPFIEFLVDKKLARSTIKKYMADLSLLGSEIVRSIQHHEDQRNWAAKKILLYYVDESGGPLPHCWDPEEFTQQRYITAYDSVCRNLYKYLSQ